MVMQMALPTPACQGVGKDSVMYAEPKASPLVHDANRRFQRIRKFRPRLHSVAVVGTLYLGRSSPYKPRSTLPICRTI